MLGKFAGYWRKSFESIEWSRNFLSPSLEKVFEDAALLTDGVIISNLVFSANPKQQVSINFNFIRLVNRGGVLEDTLLSPWPQSLQVFEMPVLGSRTARV